jgi:hypothetical protein
VSRASRRLAAPGTAPPGTDARVWSVVRATAAHGLPGAPAIPPLGAGGDRWSRVVQVAEEQRVLGLLVAAVADDAIDLDHQGRLELAQLHESWCAHDLRLERALGVAAAALDGAGIAFLVTKGPALAHRAYRDPAHRLFADLDLIVPSGQVRAARLVLAEALDASTVLSEVRPGFDERFGKETLLRTRPTPATPAGLEIDLHRTPVAGALGLAIRLPDLFDRPDSLVLGGHRFPTPGPVASVLLAAYQASVADVPPRLGAQRDLVQLVFATTDPATATPDKVAGGQADTGVDAGHLGSARPEADPVIEVARRWQAQAMLAAALTDAWAALDLPRPEADRPPAHDLLDWAGRYRPTSRERLVLDAHRRPGYVYWRQLAGVIMVEGVEARLRYLQALAWPQAGYLADRRWSMGGHLRRAGRAVSAPIRHRLVAMARRIGGRVSRRR